MMKFSNLIRAVALPLLLPLSILYSIGAFLNRTCTREPYVSKSLVLSIGNIQVGGTGKTPLTLNLSRQLIEKGIEPIVISKSYNASLRSPKEVQLSDRALEVGDEALMLKKSLPELKVFSGPSKINTLKFAEKHLNLSEKNLFIVDDGAQHHKIKKDINVTLWDASRSIFDLFSFPLGMSRESLLLSESSDFIFLNRSNQSFLSKALNFLYGEKAQNLTFEIQRIENCKKERLQKNAVLISGVGNFRDLSKRVERFLESQGLTLKGKIEAKDHDNFKKVKLEAEEIYICTEKDHDKLHEKVKDEDLYVVKSSFDQNSFASISVVVDALIEQLGEQNENKH